MREAVCRCRLIRHRSDGQRLGDEQLAGHRQAAITAGDRLWKLAELPDNELALVGDLQWSDAALGWVAVLESGNERPPPPLVRQGINHDEAFRNAIKRFISASR